MKTESLGGIVLENLHTTLNLCFESAQHLAFWASPLALVLFLWFSVQGDVFVDVVECRF